jgi:2'-5' RNA ligase
MPALRRMEWPVSEFHLVRSSLTLGSSTYETVERFPLG